MRILVDCDGPLADFILLYLELHEQLNGRRHVHADVTDFDFAKCVATKDEDERVWRHIDRSPGLVRNMVMEDGAAQGLIELRKLGRVVCVTSPHTGPTWMHERFAWLIGRGFHKRDIVMCKDKSHVAGDILIDDKPEHCIEWADENPSGDAILYGMPHNAEWPEHANGRVHRRTGWEAVLKLVSVLRRF